MGEAEYQDYCQLDYSKLDTIGKPLCVPHLSAINFFDPDYFKPAADSSSYTTEASEQNTQLLADSLINVRDRRGCEIFVPMYAQCLNPLFGVWCTSCSATPALSLSITCSRTRTIPHLRPETSTSLGIHSPHLWISISVKFHLCSFPFSCSSRARALTSVSLARSSLQVTSQTYLLCPVTTRFCTTLQTWKSSHPPISSGACVWLGPYVRLCLVCLCRYFCYAVL